MKDPADDPMQGLTIDEGFRLYVLTLTPRFAFNPGRWDAPDDLFVALPDLSGWAYVGTPANTWEACEMMAESMGRDFAARVLARQATQFVDCGD